MISTLYASVASRTSPVARVGADITVAYPHFGLLVQMGSDTSTNDIEVFLQHGLIEVIPMDGPRCDLVLYNKAVFWAAACELAGTDHQSACVAKHSFLPAEAILY